MKWSRKWTCVRTVLPNSFLSAANYFLRDRVESRQSSDSYRFADVPRVNGIKKFLMRI